MSIICCFCNKKYSNNSALNYHQKTAKFCIKIQNKSEIGEENIFNCVYCNKIFSNKHRLNSHKLICKEIKNKNFEEIINNLKQKDEQIKLFENEVSSLKTQLEIYKKISEDNHECIKDIAKQPKIYTQQIQNNNNNKYLNLTPLNLTAEIVKDKVENNFTKNNFLEGQKGVAEFVFDNLLKDENGKTKYICDDSSRHKYSYKTEDGQIMVDLRAKKLTDMIKNDIIKKSNDIISKEMKKTDDMLKYMGKILDINNMKYDDNGKFLSRLSILTQYTENQDIIDSVKELIDNSTNCEYSIEEVENECLEYMMKNKNNEICEFEKKLENRRKIREENLNNEKKEYEKLKKKHEIRKNIKL